MTNEEEMDRESIVALFDVHGVTMDSDKSSHHLSMNDNHQVISDLAQRTVAGALIAISSGAELARRVQTFINDRKHQHGHRR